MSNSKADIRVGATVTFSTQMYPVMPFKIGDKIGLSKKSTIRQNKKIKAHEMVGRLRKKKWRPLFKIVSLNAGVPHAYSITIKPYNF